MSSLLAISLEPSSYLSAQQNKEADQNLLESLRRRDDILQGYIYKLQERLATGGASLLERANPEKTVEQDLKDKIQKFEDESRSVKAKIAQIELRIFKVHSKRELQIAADHEEEYHALQKARKQYLTVEKICSALEKVPEDNIPAARKHLFELPSEIRKKLDSAVKQYHPLKKKKKGESWGHDLLEATPCLAVTLKNKNGISILRSCINKLRKEIEAQEIRLLPYFEERARDFSQKVLSGRLSHEVLENLFNSFEPDVQELIPHKPPYFGSGLQARQHEELGAHMLPDGSVSFSLLAPNAKEISIILTSHGKEELEEPVVVEMEKNPITGVWNASLENVPVGSEYYYQLKVADSTGKFVTRNKIDPYAFGNAHKPVARGPESSSDDEMPFRSVVTKNPQDYQWQDQAWMRKRCKNPGALMNIYELHPLLWKKGDKGEVLNWRELAPLVIKHCKEYHFTHIELMGVLDYPNGQPMACYQVMSFFAPNHRMGTLEDLQYFIDQLHQNKLGVILDWTPAHFCIDSFGLEQFDGSQLYESRNLIQNDDRFYAFPFEKQHNTPILQKSRHPDWNTWEFDFSKETARNFLYSSADFWLRMHIDAMRVDAVSSMIYLDYSKDEQFKWINGKKVKIRERIEFLSSEKGDKINHNAIKFMQNLNRYVHQHHPGALMIAEESTGFHGLTSRSGIGFDMSWNMGWMHRTLKDGFVKRDFGAIVHGRTLGRGDPCVYELSHDEVTHGKKALLQKMSGKDITVQFAKTRNLLAYQFCMPGAKLNMMGNEFAQSREWTHSAKARDPKDRIGVFWTEAQKPGHKGVAGMMKELGRIYKEEDALWLRNGKMDSMEYEHIDKENNVLAYHRKGSDLNEQLLCVHNFSATKLEKYLIPIPSEEPFTKLKDVQEIFSSDDERWNGHGKKTERVRVVHSDKMNYIEVSIPPHSTVIFRERFSSED